LHRVQAGFAALRLRSGQISTGSGQAPAGRKKSFISVVVVAKPPQQRKKIVISFQTTLSSF
jgi:hypothetical protein